MESENNTTDEESNAKIEQNEEHSSTENETRTETEVYSLRWWIGLFYAGQIVLLRMLTNSFGVVNNVYKAYFDISYFAIDWFLAMQYPGLCSATVILIFLILSEQMAFRKLFIIMTTCTTCSYAFSMVAFSYPKFFWLIYAGQFVSGFALQASIAIFSTFATLWFPENQVGFAMSLKVMSMSIGCLLAFLVPSQLVPPPPTPLIERKNVTLTTMSNDIEDTKWWLDEVRWKYLCLYGGSVVGCFIVWIFAIFFVADEPSKPPTVAQALIRSKRHKNQTDKKAWATCNKFWTECKSILCNKTFIYATIILTVLFSFNYLEKVLMGQISREVFTLRQYNSKINQMAGYILVLFEVGCFIGGLTGGKLTDSENRHKLILYVGITFTLICELGLVIGRHFFNVAVIFVFNTLLGVALCLNYTPLFDIVLQDAYPKNTSLVMLIFNSITQVGVVVVGQLSRLILNFSNGTVVLGFLSVLLLIILIICILLNPKFKRQEASEAETNAEEGIPLLKNEN